MYKDNRDYPPNPNAPFDDSKHLQRARSLITIGLLEGRDEHETWKDYYAIVSETSMHDLKNVARTRFYRETSEVLLEI